MLKNKKVFCESCREDRDYSLGEVEISRTLKGEDFDFVGKSAFCSSCGGEVYLPDLADRNLELLYDLYREEKDLIPLEHIREIPGKYKIGKRPLSLALGWGEVTFSRYYDGGMPSKQYSDVLKKIYQDPDYYRQVLEKNRANLRSDSAYKKSINAVDELIEEQYGLGADLDEIISYILYVCEDITPLALQKILYYIQGFYYAFEEIFLFPNDCEAWVHGPVFREVYNKYSSYSFNPIEKNQVLDTSTMSPKEKKLIDSVIKNFSCYSGKTLADFTHKEKPWLLARGDLAMKSPSNRIIEKDWIADYFKSIKLEYNMQTPEDISRYSKDLFEKRCF